MGSTSLLNFTWNGDQCVFHKVYTCIFLPFVVHCRYPHVCTIVHDVIKWNYKAVIHLGHILSLIWFIFLGQSGHANICLYCVEWFLANWQIETLNEFQSVVHCRAQVSYRKSLEMCIFGQFLEPLVTIVLQAWLSILRQKGIVIDYFAKKPQLNDQNKNGFCFNQSVKVHQARNCE